MVENISKRLKQLRLERKLSQQEVANAILVSQRIISSWESGENEPKASYIYKLAKFYDVSTDYLLGLEN